MSEVVYLGLSLLGLDHLGHAVKAIAAEGWGTVQEGAKLQHLL